MTDSTLFIRLYLDEDVSVFVAQLLRPHGFDVLTTREAHNLGYTDPAQLHFAASNHRAILTHNRGDFESLHEAALREQRSTPVFSSPTAAPPTSSLHDES